MPWLVRALATGFVPGSTRYELAVELGRITFPYLLLISLAALFASALQAGQRFAAAAFAPVLLNLAMIAALLVSGATGAHAARVLAWSILVGGVLQLAWVAVAAWRAGLAPGLEPPRRSPQVRRLGRLIAPGLLGIGVLQLNLLVGELVRQPPAGGCRLLPVLRRPPGPAAAGHRRRGAGHGPPAGAEPRRAATAPRSRDILNRAIELGLLLGLPAAVGLALLAQPIVTVLFERGAFAPAASLATAQVLAGLALGLPAQVLAKVLAPGLLRPRGHGDARCGWRRWRWGSTWRRHCC